MWQACIVHRKSGRPVAGCNIVRPSGAWDRRLEDTSVATATFRQDCCTCVIEPRCHSLQWKYNGQVCWVGPILQVAEEGGEVTVVARDASIFWETLLGADVAGGRDASVMAAELDSLTSSCLTPALEPSARTVQTTLEADSCQTVASHMANLARRDIDWTVDAGVLRIAANGTNFGNIQLTEKDFETPPRVVKVGNRVAQVKAQGRDGLVAYYPNPPAPVGCEGDIRIPVSDPDTDSVEDLERTARAVYESRLPTVGIVGTGLKTSMKDPCSLTAGASVRIGTSSCLGDPVIGRLQLVRATIQDGELESLSPTIEPATA